MITPHRNNLCSKHAEKMISIKITSACNMSCDFCVDRDGKDCNVADVFKIAEEANKLKEYKTVIITGGEPFLEFNNVIKLCVLLRKSKIRIVLNTNGSLLTRERVKELNGLIDELQISVHHYDEAKNAEVLGGIVAFAIIKDALTYKEFDVSINSTFNNEYDDWEKAEAVPRMVLLTKNLGAQNLRLTELKKVNSDQFVEAKYFFGEFHHVNNREVKDLIIKGCTFRYRQAGINVSVKRLCPYAKGANAESFSCCFVDTEGQKKIDIETEDTFKVIYSDGSVTNDWVFNNQPE